MIEFEVLAAQVESRLGRIPLMGRYHVAPRSLEDDYKATETVLGNGCSGPVLMATSICDSRRKFAVKSFTLDTLREIELTHLKGELATSLCLDHPNVARLADVYEHDNELFLVTECINGGELFQRLVSKKRFDECDAANAVRQILLALNYLHSHGIVHRDLKLENFLFDSQDSDHLKLIDFGFSKFFSKDGGRMKSTCGTLSYLTPEVLVGDYCGSTCDMWSAGVIAFVLLSGSMPFHGTQQNKVQNICRGKYRMKPEAWSPLSNNAREFTEGLLNSNPQDRLTARSALAHPWIEESCKTNQPLMRNPQDMVEALSSWKSVPKLRRACLTMLAWSLCDDERAKFRDYFLAFDHDHNGAISYAELKKAMVLKCGVAESKVKQICQDLAHDSKDEIRYSDFVAMLMSNRMNEVDDSLLQIAFRKFDKSNLGYITPEDFTDIAGLQYDGVDAASLLLEADTLKKDGRIDYQEFAQYVKPPTSAGVTRHLSGASKSQGLLFTPVATPVVHGHRVHTGNTKSTVQTLTRYRLNELKARQEMKSRQIPELESASQQQCCTLM